MKRALGNLDAERLAWALLAAHPDADPLALDHETVARTVIEIGEDPDDDELVSAALVAWEGLLN